jgi:hypothetical protein
LQKDKFNEDADALLEATVHWLRHTGISQDVKRRPREHVREDAGHSSGAITDKYIDIEFRARHASIKYLINKLFKVRVYSDQHPGQLLSFPVPSATSNPCP